MGGDRFSVAARRGNRILWVRHRNKIDHNEGTAWIKSLIDELKPARVNIDNGNIGATIVTNLKSLGPTYALIVRGVNFGGTSEHKLAKPKVAGPANRRAEMWARTRDWLTSEEGAPSPRRRDPDRPFGAAAEAETEPRFPAGIERGNEAPRRALARSRRFHRADLRQQRVFRQLCGCRSQAGIWQSRRLPRSACRRWDTVSQRQWLDVLISC
jgi:hypothetical protein